MFLWFLTLAGLSVEPIADSIFSPRIPMYEGIKIMFAGWLLLAHFYVSKPENQQHQNYTIPEDRHRISHNQLDTQPDHRNLSRRSSYLSTSERIPTNTQGRSMMTEASGNTTTPKASNLDFGRFKRDLERRRSTHSQSYVTDDTVPSIPSRSNSRLGHANPSPSASKSYSKDEHKFTPKATSGSRAISLQPGPGSTTSTPTAPVSSRKRPLSALSEDRPSPSLARNPSNLSSRSHTKPSALQRTPSGQRTGGEHRVRINAVSPGGNGRKGKRQRHSPDDKDKALEPEEYEESHTRHSKEFQGSGKSESKSNRTATPTLNATTSTSTATFSRPKPPGKNRTELPPNPAKPVEAAAPPPKDHRSHQRQSHPASSRELFSPSATETADEPQVVSASFESRMKNVRAWIKGRNPLMISPTLTATSEATATHPQLKRRSSSFLQDDKPVRSSKSGLDDLPKVVAKRKASRQLAPSANTKRWAAEDELERPSQWTVADDDRIQRPISSSSRRRRSGESESGRIYQDTTAAPSSDRRSARDSSSSRPAPVDKRNSSSRTADTLHERNRSSSQPSNLDWDRFQKLIGTAPKRPVSASAPTTWESSPSNLQRLTRKNSGAHLLGHDQDDNTTVSPLIKLRQSQLRQHQEEDFFGVKRKDDGDSGKFSRTLDLWEQEDDETLARNAAREAEEVEARSQRLSQARLDSNPSLSGSPPEDRDERGEFTFSSPSRISTSASAGGYEMAAPTPSLLRTIPFNGESSRRPVPDFQSKKSTTLQETKSPARRSSLAGQEAGSNSNTGNPFFIQSLLDKTSNSNSRSGPTPAPPPARFNFNFAGAVSLAKKRAQAQHQHQQAKASPEEVAARRERHPGLYTPSKKKTSAGVGSSEQGSLWKESQLSRPSNSPFKPSTPTVMSRYIELSSLSDED
ncbi:hypothetical protein BGX23_000205 [Mortierella sp. AD031]|nr:hypothetical protein BGX23_000205 [Mortierella sp. AD031]